MRRVGSILVVIALLFVGRFTPGRNSSKTIVQSAQSNDSSCTSNLGSLATSTPTHGPAVTRDFSAPELGHPHLDQYWRKDRQVFELATGYLDEVVIFRVIPSEPGRDCHIQRVYTPMFSILRQKYLMEEQGFRFLQELIEASQHQLDTFRVPKVLLNEEPLDRKLDTIVLEDFRGRPLDQILRDRRVPPNIKTELSAAYRQKLAGLRTIIQQHYPEAQPHTTQYDENKLIYLPDGNLPDQTVLSINTSSIVVAFDSSNPTIFEMWIADPL